MECFFCFDYFLVGMLVCSGRIGYWLIDNFFQSVKIVCNIVDYCLLILVIVMGLLGMVILGVQVDFVMFSCFMNDIGIGMINFFIWLGCICQ